VSEDLLLSAQAYPHAEVEPQWQSAWETEQTYRTPGKAELDFSAPKFYCLDMFPYPSGAGLHVGHPEGYTATDIISRYKKMKGFNVLHPMGWDAFGLPAEQFAIQTGTHPAITTTRNVNRFREQLKRLGFSYDWSREVSTTDPKYYKWTQWIFLQLYKKGLAYQAEVPVNWCPELGTVLANEEVIDGKSERGGFPVFRRPLRQWVLKITEYAQRLLDDLEGLDWPESIKEMQRQWIGRSEGIAVKFPLCKVGEREGEEEKSVEVFTTRADTLMGCTYVVLAPEHPLLEGDGLVTTEQRGEVEAYREAAARKTDMQREEEVKEKTGVFTGGFVSHPLTGETLPVWVADYVLGGYGSGAVMAVPAHDTRDFQFAQKFGLHIKRVIVPSKKEGKEGEGIDKGTGDVEGGDGLPFTLPGVLVDSGALTGLETPEAKRKVASALEERGMGGVKVTFKLRDWLFSRQRYWGEPFPLSFTESGDVVLADERSLPVTLPDMESFQPSGTTEGPLANAREWVEFTDAEGRQLRRETNTMPQWAGSCWYYLRYVDPSNDEFLVDPELEKYWLPVDLYVGGAEHAVLHLLYARFWHKVLFDCGVVKTAEPFHRLVNQGLILGPPAHTAFRKSDGSFVSASSVESRPGVEGFFEKSSGEAVSPEKVEETDLVRKGDGFSLTEHPDVAVLSRSEKMSKSKGNVVNPDDIVKDFGADALRLYLMFMGPLEAVKPWSDKGVEAMSRFLNRFWRVMLKEAAKKRSIEGTPAGDAGGKMDLCMLPDVEPTKEQRRVCSQTVQRVSESIETLRFNNGISAIMEFCNAALKWDSIPRSIAADVVRALSPFAPHIAEECWRKAVGGEGSVSLAQWPTFDPKDLEESEVTVAVQVNGKTRDTVTVPKDASKDEALKAALSSPKVVSFIEKSGKKIVKEIIIPGKIVNLILK